MDAKQPPLSGVAYDTVRPFLESIELWVYAVGGCRGRGWARSGIEDGVV